MHIGREGREAKRPSMGGDTGAGQGQGKRKSVWVPKTFRTGETAAFQAECYRTAATGNADSERATRETMSEHLVCVPRGTAAAPSHWAGLRLLAALSHPALTC